MRTEEDGRNMSKTSQKKGKGGRERKSKEIVDTEGERHSESRPRQRRESWRQKTEIESRSENLTRNLHFRPMEWTESQDSVESFVSLKHV